MNQNFTVGKKQYLYEKNSCRGFQLQKKFLHKQGVKNVFVQTENSPPLPPITFLMVHPLYDISYIHLHSSPSTGIIYSLNIFVPQSMFLLHAWKAPGEEGVGFRLFLVACTCW